jgi:hypothetical protein
MLAWQFRNENVTRRFDGVAGDLAPPNPFQKLRTHVFGTVFVRQKTGVMRGHF